MVMVSLDQDLSEVGSAILGNSKRAISALFWSVCMLVKERTASMHSCKEVQRGAGCQGTGE